MMRWLLEMYMEFHQGYAMPDVSNWLFKMIGVGREQQFVVFNILIPRYYNITTITGSL